LLSLSISLANSLSSPPSYHPLHWLQTKITHSISLSLSLSLSLLLSLAPFPAASSRHVKPPQDKSNVKSQLLFIARRPPIPGRLRIETLLHYLCTKLKEGAAKIPDGGNLSRDSNSPPVLASMVAMGSSCSKLRNWIWHLRNAALCAILRRIGQTMVGRR
jgi:hypothetical protein